MKRCVITGAASGIGKALAHGLASRGHAVIGIDVDGERAEQTRAELERRGHEVPFIIADLGDGRDRDRILRALDGDPPIDVFIHNAGINDVGRFEDFGPERQRRIVEIDFLAPMILTQGLLRGGLLAPAASLVFLSSLSSYVGYPGATVYSAAKEGLASYARSLGVELAPRGMHVLTVYPGPTRTEMAARCSPLENETAAAKRMPPEWLARRIIHAVERRRRVLIPGFKNRAFAIAGRLVPRVTEYAMRRSIYERLPAGKGIEQSDSIRPG